MLTVVINTYNEEEHIGDCIDSVKGLAAEIIVCDMHSPDKTVEIAESKGATVIFHKKEKVVELARFAAISAASYPWILVLDADERLTPKTAEKIRESIQMNYDIIFLWSRNFYFGDYMNYGGFYYQMPRCFKKELYTSSYSNEEARVHMNFSSIRKHCTSPLYLGKEYYYNHLAYPTIEKYIVKTIGYYAKVEAVHDFNNGAKFSSLKMVLGPVKTFLTKYFVLQGFRDGTRGFIVCVLYSTYEFSKWINMWALKKQSGVTNDVKRKVLETNA